MYIKFRRYEETKRDIICIYGDRGNFLADLYITDVLMEANPAAAVKILHKYQIPWKLYEAYKEGHGKSKVYIDSSVIL